MSEALWETPSSWTWATLNDVASWSSGGTPKSTEPRYYGGEIPWLIIGDLNDGVVTSSAKTITPLGLENSSAKYVEPGAVMIALYGSIGKLGIAGVRCTTNQAIAFTRSISEVVQQQFLFHYLKNVRGKLLDLGKGGTQANISQTVLKAFPICVAPLAEQRRIVAKLETLLSKVDACRQRLAKIPALLKRFRQSVLAAACSGRLTSDWREENQTHEAGDDLLNKVRKYREEFWRRSGRKGPCPESPEPDTSSLPDVPTGWSWILLGILGANPFETVQTGPFGALLHKEEFTPSGVPVVAVGNLTGMGFTKDGLYFVSDSKAEQLSRFDVQAGDVLFARSGATLGKVCVAPSDAKDWRMTGHILRARLNRDFLFPDFCVFALRGDPAVTRQVFGSIQGTTRPGYNTTLLESIALSVAPLAEQQEIVRRVEALFALADQIEARYAKAKAYVEKLTQSILAKAFRSELVSQDPKDEPASILLERIRSQRSQGSESKHKRKRANLAAVG
jgi:type I restriction enzyme, S subunit